ncbi:TetR/AcrR family transcriptional regulator [Phenylobacterium sp.]|uniref:TetR/AcrR family transcriptional regulator n=1 Tax=Phenylobacterium sp. TaxID=1871053 RepID=UPI0035B133A0
MTAATTTPRRSARKPKGDGHLRRAEILDAAERIFVAEGYEGATIRKIADEVGVSSTALYMHFQDKGSILLEICEATIKQLLERNSELSALPLDPVTRVQMMLEAYMRWGFGHPNAYELVFAPGPAVSSLWNEGMQDLGDRCYQIFSGVVREIAAAGRLRRGTADSAAQALWGACHGVVHLVIHRPHFDWAAQDELIDVTLDGLLHGLITD